MIIWFYIVLHKLMKYRFYLQTLRWAERGLSCWAQRLWSEAWSSDEGQPVVVSPRGHCLGQYSLMSSVITLMMGQNANLQMICKLGKKFWHSRCFCCQRNFNRLKKWANSVRTFKKGNTKSCIWGGINTGWELNGWEAVFQCWWRASTVPL